MAAAVCRLIAAARDNLITSRHEPDHSLPPPRARHVCPFFGSRSIARRLLHNLSSFILSHTSASTLPYCGTQHAVFISLNPGNCAPSGQVEYALKRVETGFFHRFIFPNALTHRKSGVDASAARLFITSHLMTWGEQLAVQRYTVNGVSTTSFLTTTHTPFHSRASIFKGAHYTTFKWNMFS
ncbi:hypothetical protein K504DRAFT_252676 [Pleomassaria siparia CBS 279.74]|uniref:Uncharacterized protein n=1 Tax=Pleomassaria siparia CBS 279.74 TaxID=1314801 RepID=A0A6G1KB69_9PLEO|nr:hypothetical protein K504DRAFT_252676 [Pleomassaria siparia CBS 279.74]